MHDILAVAAIPRFAASPVPAGDICDAVIALVSRKKNVPAKLLKHKSRCRAETARARQLAMYLSHVVLGRSLGQIGDAFGRDRTTVSYACALIEDLRDDAAFDEEVQQLERLLEAACGGGDNGAH